MSASTSNPELCRCCRGSDSEDNMVSLQAAPSFKSKATFEEILMRIMMSPDIEQGTFPLPPNICKKCSETLYAAEELRIVTLESDLHFRNAVQIKVEALEVELELDSSSAIKYEQEIKLEVIESEAEIGENVYESQDESEVERLKSKKKKKKLLAKKEVKTKESMKPDTKNAPLTEHRLPTQSDFACCMCIKFCDTRKQLEEHLLTHPPTATDNEPTETGANVESRKCWMCQKVFKDPKNLHLHKVRRYRPKTSIIYQCKYCGKIFQGNQSMRYCELKHEGKNEKFYCALCNATATSKTNLRTHMKVHTGERKHRCPICGFAFRQLVAMQRHVMVTHENIKDYFCEVCGHRFGSSSALKVHGRVHTGERPYPCELCTKTFIHRTDYLRHQLTHTGERPYPCPDCDKRYRSKTLLKIHYRMHIGKKEFKCKLCPVEYFQPRSLKRHMAEKHAILT